MDFHENEGLRLLVKALLSLEDEKECIDFLEDVMTRKEMMDISQRMLVAKMLSEQVVYNKIVEETGASTATISRVNRSYNYGSGGYEKILKRVKEDRR
ncbi:MAG: TrpR YerC/YecD [Ruminococcaceae bacterium]|nr:TrpR YerC/YecD [Oscillospiraceae bacterium]